MIETICHWLSRALRIIQNLVFSFQIALDTLGRATEIDCLHVLQGNEENYKVFFKGFPSWAGRHEPRHH